MGMGTRIDLSTSVSGLLECWFLSGLQFNCSTRGVGIIKCKTKHTLLDVGLLFMLYLCIIASGILDLDSFRA